jgi:hypothetical protein
VQEDNYVFEIPPTEQAASGHDGPYKISSTAFAISRFVFADRCAIVAHVRVISDPS